MYIDKGHAVLRAVYMNKNRVVFLGYRRSRSLFFPLEQATTTAATTTTTKRLESAHFGARAPRGLPMGGLGGTNFAAAGPLGGGLGGALFGRLRRFSAQWQIPCKLFKSWENPQKNGKSRDLGPPSSRPDRSTQKNTGNPAVPAPEPDSGFFRASRAENGRKNTEKNGKWGWAKTPLGARFATALPFCFRRVRNLFSVIPGPPTGH